MRPSGVKSWLAGFSLLLLLAAIFFLYGGSNLLLRWHKGVNRGVVLDGFPVEGMLEHEVAEYVRELSGSINRMPRNAYLDPETGEIAAEVPGYQVDVEVTVRNVMAAPANSMVLPEVVFLDPELTAEHYRRINREIGSFQTWIGGGNGGRATNIMLATASLNNHVMQPGDIFSFNRVNGPRTAERGYRPAPVIVGDSVVPGIGGGVCQVSTTLYNAVLRAELEVVERYPHSRPIGYVAPGMDATISDYLDFKFRNNTDHMIMIKSYYWGGSIDIRIMQD